MALSSFKAKGTPQTDSGRSHSTQAGTKPPQRIPHPEPPQANGIIQTTKMKANLATFLHGCAFSPSPTTLLRAISRGNFNNWPGMTIELISKHLPKSMATSKGHMRMQQKNIQSTRIEASPLPLATSLDVVPAQETLNAATDNIFITTVNENDICKSYSDQTGKFPARSSRGNQYVFVLYDYDSNVILTQSIPNRQAKEITNFMPSFRQRRSTNTPHPRQRVLRRAEKSFPQVQHTIPTRTSPQP
jgi:hypothetical protein